MYLWIWCLTGLVGSACAMACDTTVEKVASDHRICMHASSHPYVHYTVNAFSPDETGQAHCEERPQAHSITTLVMGDTGRDFSETMQVYTDHTSQPRVSSHYVITRRESSTGIPGGTVVQIVPEHKRAWHAGASYWKGTYGLDDTAIGISNVNYGFDAAGTWGSFDANQIRSLGALSRDIVKRYGIQPSNVVGHADIAPDREVTPGVMFPWTNLFYFSGVGAWLENRSPQYVSARYASRAPLPQGVSEPFVLSALATYGYPVHDRGYNTPENQAVVRAFKAHFSANQRPQRCNSEITRDEMVWIWGLLAKYKDG